VVREAVEGVGTDGCCAGYLCEGHDGPSGGESDNGKFVLEGLAVENHGANSESDTGPDTPESVFWLVFAIVGLDVTVAKEIVEPVTPELTDNGTYNGCEVEERCVGVVKEIWWGTDELGYGCDDTNGPGEEDEDEECYDVSV